VCRTHSDGRLEAARDGTGRAASIRFHAALGFTVGGPVRDYNGPGRDMVTFELKL
jgi:L-amino acid N-acyltransferase YncA